MYQKVNNETQKKLIIVTQDYSGLGFAKRATEELGYENVILAYRMKDKEENEECFDLVGNGIAEKMELDELMENREDFRDWYFMWDGNHNYEDADLLRLEGFKVFGGMELQDKMEHDRNFGMELVKQAGLDTLPYQEFNNPQDGIDYLEQNQDKAFVFKPDAGEGCYTTYVPDHEDDHEANEELRKYMTSLDDDGTTYILQERIKGLEYNIEAWIYKGKPVFAFVCLESKRKLNKDEGEMVGCSQDVSFVVPLEAKILKNTVYKLLPHIPEDYTGFLDCNILNKDKKDYFIEFCARFGYNAHPNLFWNLAISPFTEILFDLMDGNIDDFYRHFRYGFGSSVTLYIDHPRKGLPFHKDKDLHGHFYHFDTYREYDEWGDPEYYLAGYANEVGIVCAHGFTIKESAKECLRLADKIHFPMHAMRSDLDKNDYPTEPGGRYMALVSMDYLE